MTPAQRLYEALCAQGKALGRRLTKEEYLAVFEREIAVIVKESAKERKRAAIIPDAEQVYDLYPKKVGREDALRAISNALKKHDLAYLLGKTNQFKECVESWPSSYRYFQDGGDRCPHPASWFNAGRYADDPREWKRHGARSAPQNKISPPEPINWRESFPEFVDRDKPWNLLQPAQQAYIVANMETAAHFSEPIRQDEHETRLRHA